VVKERTATSISLKPITSPYGTTVKYAYSTSNSAPTSGWQESTEFKDLTSATKYYFFARYEESDSYYQSEPSSSVSTNTYGVVGIVKMTGDLSAVYAQIKYYELNSDALTKLIPSDTLTRGSAEYNALVGSSLKDATMKWYLSTNYHIFWNVAPDSSTLTVDGKTRTGNAHLDRTKKATIIYNGATKTLSW